jgi:hypothetical protein
MNNQLKTPISILTNYLDLKNPIKKIAYESAQSVSNADVGDRLKIFDAGIARLHNHICEWVSDGFSKFYEIAQRAEMTDSLDWADQRLCD